MVGLLCRVRLPAFWRGSTISVPRPAAVETLPVLRVVDVVGALRAYDASGILAELINQSLYTHKRQALGHKNTSDQRPHVTVNNG